MDAIDAKIIAVLKENSRAATSEISKKVNLSIPAVAERIRKMEESGFIEAYTIKINRKKARENLLAFIFITLDRTEHIAVFKQAALQLGSVLEIHHVAGEYDYLLKVLVADPESLEDFISNQLKMIKGVIRSNTIIALSSLKENINL